MRRKPSLLRSFLAFLLSCPLIQRTSLACFLVFLTTACGEDFLTCPEPRPFCQLDESKICVLGFDKVVMIAAFFGATAAENKIDGWTAGSYLYSTHAREDGSFALAFLNPKEAFMAHIKVSGPCCEPTIYSFLISVICLNFI